MKKKELGRTGIYLPPIIFGTSALGNLYTEISEENKLEIISECFRHVTKPVVFDCAGKYGAGLALEMLGKCLKKLQIQPEDVIISNKLGWLRTPLTSSEPTFETGVWKNLKYDAIQRINYKSIIECYDQGNELLGGTYKPQLVSVHDPDEYLKLATNSSDNNKYLNDIIEAYQALSDLKAVGKVKAVGVGAKDWKAIELISKHVDLDWVMFANSMTIMNHPPELLAFMDKLHQKGVGIINSAVFQGGFLTGSNYYNYSLVTPETDKEKFIWRDTFFNLCKKSTIKPSTACVNFGMTFPGVAAISLNTSNPERIKENVASVIEEIPNEFYHEMVLNGLISKDYPYLKL